VISNPATKMVVGSEEPSNPSLLISPAYNTHLVNTLPHVDVVSMCDMSVCIDNLPNFCSNFFATVVSCPFVLTDSPALSASVVVGTQALQNGALTLVRPSGSDDHTKLNLTDCVVERGATAVLTLTKLGLGLPLKECDGYPVARINSTPC